MLRLVTIARWAGAIGIGVSCTPAALAQAYPTRPITLVVPVAPSGGTDFAARLIAERLTDTLGRPVVVENRPGSSGNIGVGAVAKAPPDGYTLVMPITSFPINPALYANLPFDTKKDLTPVALVGTFPLLLVVNPKLPVNTVEELIALARQKPGSLNFANSGTGTTAHLAGEMFKRMAGVDIVSVPYKGGGPAVSDLIGGYVQMYFSTVPAVLPHVEAGMLRALAVTGDKRLAELPSVPTLRESGLDDFNVTAWFGIFAPAGTPQPIVDKLNQATNTVLAEPDMQQKLGEHGFTPGGRQSPGELRTFVDGEVDRWGAIVRELGVRVE